MPTIYKKLENTKKFLGRFQTIFSGIIGASADFSTTIKSAQRTDPTAREDITNGLVQGKTFPPVLSPRTSSAVDTSSKKQPLKSNLGSFFFLRKVFRGLEAAVESGMV